MARRRYDTLTPASGLATFPTTVMEDRRFLGLFFDRTDKTATITVTDEEITVSGTTDGLFRLDYVPKGQASDTISSVRVLDIWSGASKTGTQFTPISADTSFGAATSREFRHYVGTNEVDFSADQISNGSFTTLYATYLISHSQVDPETMARMWEEIQATQTYVKGGSSGSSDIPNSFSAVDGGSGMSRGFGAMDRASLTVNQFSDPRDLDEITALVWVDDTVSAGATFTAYLSGRFAKPSSITSLPVARELWAGNNGLITWDNDPSANALDTGDYIRTIGSSFDNSYFYLDLMTPTVRGKK